MSQDWKDLGNKFELAHQLEEITHIPADVLRHERSFTEISIADRMSWASKRQTTRIEDEAYCLFGLFGVNMAPLYGEGPHAFYRLQEEIMKTSVDTTLFAAGIRKQVADVEQLEEYCKKAFRGLDVRYFLAERPSRFDRSPKETNAHLVFDPEASSESLWCGESVSI